VSRDVPGGSSNRVAGDAETEADSQSARDADQTSLDTDQTLSDVDQGGSDADQAAADSDRTASQLDDALASADQIASDRDQVAAARDLAEVSPVDPERWRAHEISLTEREVSTAERAATAALRAQAAEQRLDVADRRDEASRLRDLAAKARDRAAEARDRLAAQIEPVGPVAEARAQAAADRARAAADRERAAADREQAALDRQQVRAALSQVHLDDLTGTYRRGLGTLALEREINRARHSDGRLVLAFVDVDGLKEVNDREGHHAGDALLIDVAATIRSKLRLYDPIVRFGGDEFVCAFADFGLDDVRRRFEEIQAALDQRRKGCSISVGFAELQSDDTLHELTARGDADLYEAKRRKQKGMSADGGHRPSGVGAGGPGPRHRLRLKRRTDLRYCGTAAPVDSPRELMSPAIEG
jgi:diguanylate cyclase (GGDEF)-like protein